MGKAAKKGKVAVVPKKPAPAKTQTAAEKEEERRAAVREHFRRFDLNGDGKVSHEEFTMVLTSCDPGAWTDEKIEALLNCVDKNGDGSINLDEFCDWMFGDAENTAIADAVKAISAEGCEYVVLEVLDNMCAFLRTPTGAIIAALHYSRESGGFGNDLVFSAGRAFTAEAALRNHKLPKDVPVVVVLDAARPGGNYLPAAVFGLLVASGYDLSDPTSSQVMFVVAAPTLSTPRACTLGSSSLGTRFFLWELQRAAVKSKYEGKVAFVARESLYVGQETLYKEVIPAAVSAMKEAPEELKNIGGGAVERYLKTMGETLKKHSKAMEKAGCEQPFRYASHEKFGQYIKFEPEKENNEWVTSYPPGYGAEPTATLAGHTSKMLIDSEDTNLFELGDTPSEGRRIIDSMAAEASPEKIFLVTRLGLSDPRTGPAARVLKEMCEDPGVTHWHVDKVIETFGPIPGKDDQKYQEYLENCREAMDGIVVLDFPVDYWANDFLVDLISADYITIVQVVSPGYSYERFFICDGSGFDTIDFRELKTRLPFAALSAIVTLPEDDAPFNDWAHAGAFIWGLREVADGLIVLPAAATAEGGWGGKFLSTWMSITSTTLKHRFKGHLGIEPPLNIFMPYYGEGESSSAAIDHTHVLQKTAPMFASFTVSCGMQAGYRLEALLDRISKKNIFGSVTNGDIDEVYLQAAGETSDDHGAGSLDQGAVRYATLVAGGKDLITLVQKLVTNVAEKAEKEGDPDWKKIVDGDIGLKTWILPEFKKVTSAITL